MAPVNTRSSTPTTEMTTRTPSGRNVCGSRTGRSESAGMDVRGEDAAGPEVEKLVHDLLRIVARHHRAYGDPALATQRRHRRALDARGQRDRPLDVVGVDVVVHHHVRPSHQDA